MNKYLLFCTLALSCSLLSAQQATVTGPDKNLKVDISVNQVNHFTVLLIRII